MTEAPSYGADRLVRGMSLARRVGYVVAGLGGGSVAALIALLWATEPVQLPMRTRVAFAGLVVVGMSWAVLAGWALISRPLFAADRLVAAVLAVIVSTLMLVASVSIALARGSTSGALLCGVLGAAFVAAAVVLLSRARAYRAALLARLHGLQSGPSAGDTAPAARHELLPIGVLGIALRRLHGGTGDRRIVVVTLVLTVALLIGGVLLLR